MINLFVSHADSMSKPMCMCKRNQALKTNMNTRPTHAVQFLILRHNVRFLMFLVQFFFGKSMREHEKTTWQTKGKYEAVMIKKRSP